jgi:hypothetical protein
MRRRAPRLRSDTMAQVRGDKPTNEVTPAITGRHCHVGECGRPAPGWRCDELVFGLNQLHDPAPGECEGEHARDDPQCHIHDDLHSPISCRVLSGTVISARVPPRTDECAWITPMVRQRTDSHSRQDNVRRRRGPAAASGLEMSHRHLLIVTIKCTFLIIISRSITERRQSRRSACLNTVSGVPTPVGHTHATGSAAPVSAAQGSTAGRDVGATCPEAMRPHPAATGRQRTAGIAWVAHHAPG